MHPDPKNTARNKPISMTINPKKATDQRGSSWKRSRGFTIGKNKPGVSQSVYLGKAEKIKKTLIHKAKLKKQRAKELAKAGYSATSDQTAKSRPTDDQEQAEPSERSHPRESQPGPGSRRPQKDPKISAQPSPTCKHPSNQRLPIASERAPQNSSACGSEPYSHSNKKERYQDQYSSNHQKNPIKLPKAKIHHANGQPKLSHRVSKILSKLERGKDQ